MWPYRTKIMLIQFSFNQKWVVHGVRGYIYRWHNSPYKLDQLNVGLKNNVGHPEVEDGAKNNL